ncbi:hypothetical protein ACFL5V_00990 [Fibrobacterota bacterium]
MTITINHKALIRVFSRWHIAPPLNKLVILGFRGMLPVRPGLSPKLSWDLKKVSVDYKHMRCTLGIWDPISKKIFLAPGSTVPYIDYVKKAALREGRGANQMEPGYYADYSKGEHLEGMVRGHQALRQSGLRFVRRTVRGAPYRKTDRMYFGNPYDNLHCAWNRDPKKLGFSSGGCLVVAGMPHCRRQERPVPNQGHWRVFHQIIYQTTQRKFPILLLEAAKLKQALEHTASKPLLCYGSEGKAVRKLQRMLKGRGVYKGPFNGRMDSRTYRAWNKAGFVRA